MTLFKTLDWDPTTLSNYMLRSSSRNVISFKFHHSPICQHPYILNGDTLEILMRCGIEYESIAEQASKHGVV